MLSLAFFRSESFCMGCLRLTDIRFLRESFEVDDTRLASLSPTFWVVFSGLCLEINDIESVLLSSLSSPFSVSFSRLNLEVQALLESNVEAQALCAGNLTILLDPYVNPLLTFSWRSSSMLSTFTS